jgi:hypothetical protein
MERIRGSERSLGLAGWAEAQPMEALAGGIGISRRLLDGTHSRLGALAFAPWLG